MKVVFVFCFALMLSCQIMAQDTLTIMHYNVLNYGNYYGDCTTLNNNIDNKANYLKPIIQSIKPDIFTVNEIACDASIADHLLNNALNTDGVQHYKRGIISCTSLPYISNVLFYKSDKLRYYSHHPITTDIRDINVNTLYYYSNDLIEGDTTFLHCIVAHLKAGNDADDADQRAEETTTLMDYLRVNVRGNILLMGDLNVYQDSELCFQNLINESNSEIKFYDPIDQTGNWHNNENYAMYHTQSTHASDDGCPVSGGMDDRFDFILINGTILNGQDAFSYLENSYYVFGQDGNHFNQSVNAQPLNPDMSPEMIENLYQMSDHLPVVMKLYTDKTLSVKENSLNPAFRFSIFEHSENNLKIVLHASDKSLRSFTLSVYDLYGKTVFKTKIGQENINNGFSINTASFNSGIFLFVVESQTFEKQTQKFVKL